MIQHINNQEDLLNYLLDTTPRVVGTQMLSPKTTDSENAQSLVVKAALEKYLTEAMKMVDITVGEMQAAELNRATIEKQTLLQQGGMLS